MADRREGRKRAKPKLWKDSIWLSGQWNTLFISVTSSLAKDGTFWCRYWTSQDMFSHDMHQEINDELSVLNTESIAVDMANEKNWNQPMFIYSKTHKLYVRIAILKYTQSEQALVRYLDYGTVSDIPADTEFYYLPKTSETNYPYLSMYCALSDDASLVLPYEAKWRFRDLTTNQVLMARVVKTIECNGLCCKVVEMKSFIGENLHINKQVMEKVERGVQEMAEKASIKKKMEDDSTFKRPCTPIATIEPVKKSQPCESRVTKTITSTIDNNKSGSSEVNLSQNSSTKRNESRNSSTERNESRNSNTEKNGSQNSSTEKNGSRNGSTERTGSRNSSTEKNGSRNSSTERTGSRNRSTERNGSRKCSTEKNGSRNSSTEKNGCGNRSTERNRCRNRSSPSTAESARIKNRKIVRASSLTTINKVGKYDSLSRSTDSLMISKTASNYGNSEGLHDESVQYITAANVLVTDEIDTSVAVNKNDNKDRDTSPKDVTIKKDSNISHNAVLPNEEVESSSCHVTTTKINVNIGHQNEQRSSNNAVVDVNSVSSVKSKTRNNRHDKINIEKHSKSILKVADDEQYWVDLIPIADRANVPPFLPPMANLFYTATKLRHESWQDIELLNIQKLLRSQANIQFFFYDIFVHELFDSFEDGLLQVQGDAKCLVSRRKTSRYFIFRDVHTKGFLGIAKMEVEINSQNFKQCPITYLSLSAPIKTPVRWRKSTKVPCTPIELKEAKSIVVYIRDSVRFGKNSPLFPDVYPWSGVPPLMDALVKPDVNKKKDSHFSFDSYQCESFSKESWDDEELDTDSNKCNIKTPTFETMPDDVEDLKQVPIVSSDTAGAQFTTEAVAFEESREKEFKPKRILKRPEGDEVALSCAEEKAHVSLLSSPDAFSPESLEELTADNTSKNSALKPREIKLRKHRCGGYYDESGMWYPSVDAAKVIPVRTVSEESIDQNHNAVPCENAMLEDKKDNCSDVITETTELQNHVTVVDEYDCKKNDMVHIERCIERLIESPTFSLHSDDDELDEQQRLERDYKLFGVTKEDIEHIQ